MIRGLFEHFMRSLIDWWFRRRWPGLVVMGIGAGLVVAALAASFAFNISFPEGRGRFQASFSTGEGAPQLVVTTVILVGLAFMIVGGVWALHQYVTETRRAARKKIIVVEMRGLRDSSGTPLAEAVPPRLEGIREPLMMDLRQAIRDGEIVDLEAALRNLTALPGDLKRRFAGLDRSDIGLVYGGMAPVPLTFLAGVLMDDEGAVQIMDWDRHAARWRELDGEDDGRRFTVAGLGNIPQGTQEVALAVSVSYQTDLDGIRCRLPGVPVVGLSLDVGGTDCHWSDAKQRALGQQFLDTVIAIGNAGVRRIHLFLAAQNSVVFRFGCLYDKRNLPEVVVYQYHRERTPPYSWGVLMPTHGIPAAAVIQ